YCIVTWNESDDKMAVLWFNFKTGKYGNVPSLDPDNPVKFLKEKTFQTNFNHINNLVKIKSGWPKMAEQYDKMTREQQQIFIISITNSLVRGRRYDEYAKIHTNMSKNGKIVLEEARRLYEDGSLVGNNKNEALHALFPAHNTGGREAV
ncbi:MAG: hypothetical protein MPI93_06400, partial [Nitrosopumilus sp.]|nr:hypothetical protein [Nitrosopumilus sp.]